MRKLWTRLIVVHAVALAIIVSGLAPRLGDASPAGGLSTEAPTVTDLGSKSLPGEWNSRGNLYAYTVDLGPYAYNGMQLEDYEVHVRDVAIGSDRVVLSKFMCPSGSQSGPGNLEWATSANVLLLAEPLPTNIYVTGIFIYDADTGVTTKITSNVAIPSGGSCEASIQLSGDGRYVQLLGNSPNDPAPAWEMGTASYIYDRINETTTKLDNAAFAVQELNFTPIGHRFLAAILPAANFYSQVATSIVNGDASTGALTTITKGNFDYGISVEPTAWSPDGSSVWFSTNDGTGGAYHVYDFNTRVLYNPTQPNGATIGGKLGWIRGATTPTLIYAIYPNSNSTQYTDVRWIPEDNNIQTPIAHGGTLSPAGTILTTQDITSGIWTFTNTRSGVATSVSLPASVYSYSWSGDESYLIGGGSHDGNDSQPFLYKLGDTAVTWLSPVAAPYSYPRTASRDGKFVALLQTDALGDPNSLIGSVAIYDAGLNKLVDAQVAGAFVGSIDFDWSPTLDVLAAATVTGVRLIALPTEKMTLTATPSTPMVGSRVMLSARLLAANGTPMPGKSVTFGVISGPDVDRFAAIVTTDATGSATTPIRGFTPGIDTVQAWMDSNGNGIVDPGEPWATATVAWRPTPVTILLIQGIASSSTCSSSSDFIGRVSWLQGSLQPLLGPGSKFLYYAYRSPYTSSPTCSPSSSVPNYKKTDSCWSLDDSYSPLPLVTKPVPGGGEATRLAAYLRSYLDSHPGETISIVAHSQGGVLASYVVKAKLSSTYTKRIQSITTYDSPLGGINSAAAELLRDASWCGNFDNRLDSPYDMLGKSAVIQKINDSSRPLTLVYTVDANPGYLCAAISPCHIELVDDAHSTTWWATSHIQIAAETHGNIWDGCFIGMSAASCKQLVAPTNLNLQGRELVRFTACAADALAPNCATYAKS